MSDCTHPHLLSSGEAFPAAIGVATTGSHIEHLCCGEHPRCSWISEPTHDRPGDLVHVGDLVGNTDVAREFNVQPTAVTNWRMRHPPGHHHAYPEPVLKLNNGTTFVWRWSDIKAWAMSTGRMS